jgi:hypothetical protein
MYIIFTEAANAAVTRAGVQAHAVVAALAAA